MGNTGKKRDELAIERTVNNINDIEKASGGTQFRPLNENHSPGGTLTRAGKAGYPYEMDVFSKDFRLVDVQGQDDPRHQEFRNEEDNWRGDGSEQGL